VEEPPPGLPADREGPAENTALEAREVRPGHWRIEVPRTPGLVVVSESFDPDWVARRDDGTDLPILRADGLFLAFVATAEGGSVELRHAPRSVRRGAIVSAAALACVLVAMLLARGRRIPGLPSHVRPVPHAARWVVVTAPILLVAVCILADVGGASADRARSSLAAAAAQSWSAEALAALRAGATEEAVRLSRIAASRDANDASLAYRLGLAERAAGRPSAARDAFQRALAIDGSFAPAQAALSHESEAPKAAK
jgi:tetratricopeptide (TPR) repeat protein